MLTHRTQPRTSPAVREEVTGGAMHLTFSQKGDRDMAIEAVRKLKAIAAKIKPNPQQGGAAAVRELRDAG